MAHAQPQEEITMAGKKKYPVYTSPKGVAKYAHLSQPQTYKGKTAYAVELILDPELQSTKDFIAFIEAQEKAGFAEAQKMYPKVQLKSKLWKAETNKDEEDNQIPTGKIAVKFAHAAFGEKQDGSKWEFKPTLMDANTAVLPKGIVIFGGSVIKVSYGVTHTTMPGGGDEPDKYYAKLSLQGIQVLTLRDSFTRSAGDLGFQKEEGYSSEDAFGEQAEEAGDTASAEAQAGGTVPDF
jgi:hypothetical protein